MHLSIAVFQSPGPELLLLGPFSLRWYGLLIAIAVFTGLNLSTYLAKKNNLDYSAINDLLPLLVLSGIIGARAYYVFFEWNAYKDNFLDIFAIWRGGIAIHGALLSGTLALIFFCRLRKLAFWDFLDVIVPSVALGQAIGRWGNFFNNEAFGLPTNLPWKIYIPYMYRPEEFINNEYFHPTFLYESIWNFTIFFVLILLLVLSSKRYIRLHPGVISCIYMISYSSGRIWIEGLRTDSLCIGALPPSCEGGIRIAQVVSIILIGIASLGITCIYIWKKELPDPSNFRKGKTNT